MPSRLRNKHLIAVLTLCAIASTARADEPVTPAISGVVAGGLRIRLIKDGFNGTEGPIALPDGSLIFTETQADRIIRIAEDGSTSTFLADSNGANGLAFAANGDLYAVQTLRPAVGIVYPSEHAKALVERFEGQPLLRPNDLVLDRGGGIYFTDPGVFPKAGDPAPAQHAVYYRSAAGELRRIANDFKFPNGVQLSPDQKRLYVADTFGESVVAYDIAADGSVGSPRNFAKLAGWREADGRSGADGMAVDALGRLYVASNAGIEVFADKGQALGIIELPKPPQNLAFAGPDRKTLYAVGRGAVYRFAVLTAGVADRAK